jgi:hypothetical protein
MGQGFFESDDDYRDRIAREADERTVENSTGSAPSQGWLESDDDYRERISIEANERRIEDSSGEAPSQGWLESDDDYRDRISQEANERTIEDATSSAPSQGWLEGDEHYDTRVREEANEHIVESETGSTPKQGWLEGDHEYRSRIAHEAREHRASERSHNAAADSSSESSPGYGSGSSGESNGGVGGWVWVILAIAAVIFFASGRNSESVRNSTNVQPPLEPHYNYSQNSQPDANRSYPPVSREGWEVMTLRGTWPKGYAPTKTLVIPDPRNPTLDTIDAPLHLGDDLELILEPLWIIDFETIGKTIEIAVDEGGGFQSLNQLQVEHDLIQREEGKPWLLKRRIIRFHRTNESMASVAPLRLGIRKYTEAEVRPQASKLNR